MQRRWHLTHCTSSWDQATESPPRSRAWDVRPRMLPNPKETKCSFSSATVTSLSAAFCRWRWHRRANTAPFLAAATNYADYNVREPWGENYITGGVIAPPRSGVTSVVFLKRETSISCIYWTRNNQHKFYRGCFSGSWNRPLAISISSTSTQFA